MLQIELVTDLDHCIETVARARHREMVSRLLSSAKDDRVLMENAELLRNFLETADFKRLRSESERHLEAGKRVAFVIYPQGAVAKWEMRVD